jgi:hypothetical protein
MFAVIAAAKLIWLGGVDTPQANGLVVVVGIVLSFFGLR